jgi:hypothetical protein
VADEYSRGFRDGYTQGKEVGLAESGRGGEVAALRAELEHARNHHDGFDHCTGCQAAYQALEAARDA